MRPGSRSIALVAWREITERTQGRAFLISTIVIVAMIVAGVVVPGLNDQTTRVHAGITGATPASLTSALRDAARAQHAQLRVRRYPTVAAGEKAVRDGETDVLIVAAQRLVWKSEPDAEVAAAVTSAVQRVRFTDRAAALGLTAAQTGTLLAPAPLPARSLEPVDPDDEARQAIAFVCFIVLLLMILVYGSAVSEGVAQEKGTRVMELLVCRVRPRDLLAGKVLGIGVVGLGQMLLGLVAGGVAIVAFDTVDVPNAVPAALASAVLWFALGYAFWSVAFAAVGALVSRVEDLQAAVAPLTWTMTLSALVAPVASEAPDAWYVRVASLLPITAPFVMPVRIAVSSVAPWEVVVAARDHARCHLWTRPTGRRHLLRCAAANRRPAPPARRLERRARPVNDGTRLVTGRCEAAGEAETPRLDDLPGSTRNSAVTPRPAPPASTALLDRDRQRSAVGDAGLAAETAPEPVDEHDESVRDLVALDQELLHALQFRSGGQHLHARRDRLAARLAVHAA
jgi:ABC-2 type transport system permease protein